MPTIMAKVFYILTILMLFFGCGQTDKKQTEKRHSFEKIIFHTTGCLGTCPTYHLQLDANKQIKLFAETVYKNDQDFSIEEDAVKTGYFKGVANDSTFALLDNELKNIGLDTLEFDSASYFDVSLKTIIVYYDGKRKFLKSMFPPDKANKLIGILYDICEKSILTRTTRKFDIENEKASR
jgi:hypothetical protein